MQVPVRCFWTISFGQRYTYVIPLIFSLPPVPSGSSLFSQPCSEQLPMYKYYFMMGSEWLILPSLSPLPKSTQCMELVFWVQTWLIPFSWLREISQSGSSLSHRVTICSASRSMAHQMLLAVKYLPRIKHWWQAWLMREKDSFFWWLKNPFLRTSVVSEIFAWLAFFYRQKWSLRHSYKLCNLVFK